MAYYVPKQMKEKNSWGYWKKETRDGKVTKIPVNAKTLRNAKTDTSDDWIGYDECFNKASQVKDKVNGLGFRFAKEQRITFIDLDHCIENGVINDWAKSICERFKDTYQELSQSKTGIHIFALGNIDKAIKNDKIEMYDWGRYVAFTGNCINQKDLAEYQEEITKLYNENKPQDTFQPQRVEIEYNPSDIQSVLENIKKSRNSYTFFEYFNGIKGVNSESTLALASILAFWTQKNHAMIRDIMRSSALYREKMESKRGNGTWLDYVIDRAITSCREVYNPKIKKEYVFRDMKKELKEIEMYGQKLYHKLGEIEYSTEQKYRCLSNIRTLDKLVGGFTYDCITLWSSQTNGGKSTLLGMLSREFIKQGKKVFYFAGEHTKEKFQSILYRQLAKKEEIKSVRYRETEIYDHFIKPEALRKIERFYADNMIIYDNECSRDIDAILYAMTECYEKEGVRDFVIDNLMQIDITSQDINREQNDIMEKLRTFAVTKECNIHLIAHPRKGMDNNIRLSMFDVAGTMNIANKSYNIISIIRTSQLREGTREYGELKQYCYHNNYDFDETDCILEVLKQKEGAGMGIVCMEFDPVTMSFKELVKKDMSSKINDGRPKGRF